MRRRLLPLSMKPRTYLLLEQLVLLLLEAMRLLELEVVAAGDRAGGWGLQQKAMWWRLQRRYVECT